MLRIQDRMNFHAPTRLGKSRSITPEGFLLCAGVAIGRTGTLRYTRDELRDETGNCPFDTGADCIVTVSRTADEVFEATTLASFEGKPVTVFHPDQFVTPENWKQVSVGIVTNVRRGVGDEADLMVADLLITDAAAIQYVNDKLPEVSSGYDADYVQTEVGRAVQKKIRGNHVALVDRGRAGPRCAIRDNQPTEDSDMKITDRIKALFKAIEANDEAAVQAALKEDAPSIDQAKLDKALAFIDKLAAKDAAAEAAAAAATVTAAAQKKATEDAAAEAAARAATGQTKVLTTGDALQALKARAEILAPGITLPAGDSLDETAVNTLMQQALTKAYSTDAGKASIQPFLLGTSDVQVLEGPALVGVFSGAAELTRVRNNDAAQARGTPSRDFAKSPVTPEEQNKINEAFWAKRI